MIKIQLHGKETVSINAMVDSGATEDFIDKGICEKHGIKMMQRKTKSEIYLADGKPSDIGPVTHQAEVPMDISSHRETSDVPSSKLEEP
jgi:hypothetical protein